MESEFFPFRTVSERFRLIDDPTVTIYIPIGEGKELVGRLRDGEGGRGLYRRLGQYGVSVYERQFEALDRSGAVERLADGSFALADLTLYSDRTGLAMDAEGGKSLFV